MAVTKIVPNPYKTKLAMSNLLYYIVRGAETVGGYGVSLNDVEAVYYEFEKIKQIWGKHEEGRRQVRQVVVSFRRNECSIAEVERIAWEVGNYYGQAHQVLYGIHDDTDNLHIHYAINTVSFIDGKMISEGQADMENLIAFVEATAKSVRMRTRNSRINERVTR